MTVVGLTRANFFVGGGYEDGIDTILIPPAAQYGAKLRKETPLEMRVLQPRASLCKA
jgi:hypothetical protein